MVLCIKENLKKINLREKENIFYLATLIILDIFTKVRKQVRAYKYMKTEIDIMDNGLRI